MPPILPWILVGFGIWLFLTTLLYLDLQKKLSKINIRRIRWERLRNWVKTVEACQKWRECNPFTHISHPEAQTLLRVHNGAFMLLLEVDPDFDDGRLEKFIALMEKDSP